MPFTFLRNWKRKRIMKQPFPATWEPHLHGLPFFHQLNGEEQAKLRRMVQVFVAEKDFEAALTQTATYIKPMEVMEFVPKVGK